MTAWVRLLLVGAAVLVAALGASFQTHSWPSTIMVLIPSAALLAVAARQPSPEPAFPRADRLTESVQRTVRAWDTGRDPRVARGLLLWSVLVGAVLLWEAYAFVQQPDWSQPSHDYPTMSTLLDPVLEHGPLRVVGWLVWLGIGARLVFR